MKKTIFFLFFIFPLFLSNSLGVQGEGLPTLPFSFEQFRETYNTGVGKEFPLAVIKKDGDYSRANIPMPGKEDWMNCIYFITYKGTDAGCAMKLLVVADDSSNINKWAINISKLGSINEEGEYNDFVHLSRLFLQALLTDLTDNDAFQIIYDAISTSVETDYQYQLFGYNVYEPDEWRSGIGVQLPNKGGYEFYFLVGGNWLELDVRAQT